MAVDLRVRNFQSIRDATIRIEGFTIVTGTNNTGKTALIRAFKALASNAKGHAFVRYGTNSCLVDIRLTDGQEVSWEKGERVKPRYVLQGHEFHPGREVPQEVIAVGIAPIDVGDRELWPQIASQFSGQVFLLDQPGSVMAEMVADVDRVGHLNRALRASDSRRRASLAEMTAQQTALDTAQVEVASLAGLDDAIALLVKVETTRKALCGVQTRLEAFIRLCDQWKTHRANVASLAGLLEVAIPASNHVVLAQTLEIDLDQVAKLRTRMGNASHQLASLAGVSEVLVPESALVSDLRSQVADKAKADMLCARRVTALQDVRALSPMKDFVVPLDDTDILKMSAGYNALCLAQGKLATAKDILDRLQKAATASEDQVTTSVLEFRKELNDLGVCPTCEQDTQHVQKHCA